MDQLHVYELGYKDGCGCCLNEGDRWVGVVTDIDPEGFLAELRRRLPDVPLTHRDPIRNMFDRDKEYPYHDPEMVQVALEGMGGVVLSRWSEYGPEISGQDLADVHNIVELGSIENIMNGGTWAEVSERHRVMCEAKRAADKAEKDEKKRQADLAELERLKREYDS